MITVFLSVLLQEGKGLGVANTFLYNLPVFDVLAHVHHSRVEDITQTVLSQIFLRYYPKHPRVGVLGIYPQRTQLGHAAQPRIDLPIIFHEVLEIDVAMVQDAVGVGDIFVDEEEDGFLVIFGDVFGLA